MAKTKTLKKQKPFSLADAPIVKLKAGVKTYAHDPLKELTDPKFVADALAEAILDGDKDAFFEILQGALQALNVSAALRHAKMKPRTYYDALENKNPRLDTLMKLFKVGFSETHR